jgi:APA family basic amino acid/polyamine antiporter
MRPRKLGPVLLTGFIIGPILGSGIIILPPLAYELLGNWALPAWAGITLVGALFAAVFGSLSIIFPGDSGVSQCVASAFGPRAKTMTSLFLMGAVCVGPVAVALTAARYLGLGAHVPDGLVAAGLVVVIWLLLLRRISSLGSAAFILSSGAALLLLVGGIGCLLSVPAVPMPSEPLEPARFGYGLLLLFWTVVGWEIIGNYSAEIRDPIRTIPRSVALSVTVIAAVTLIVAAAMQSVGGRSMTDILEPVFGAGSVVLLSVLSVALCLVTELAFTGAVSRLVAALAVEGVLPAVLGRRNGGGAPAAAATTLSAIHLGVLALNLAGVLSVEKLVAVANAFFLANAIMALLAGARILPSRLMRVLSAGLAAALGGMLAMSTWPVLLALGVMTVWGLGRRNTTIAPHGGRALETP